MHRVYIVQLCTTLVLVTMHIMTTLVACTGAFSVLYLSGTRTEIAPVLKRLGRWAAALQLVCGSGSSQMDLVLASRFI